VPVERRFREFLNDPTPKSSGNETFQDGELFGAQLQAATGIQEFSAIKTDVEFCQ
jgi:hypothetical protein